MASSAKFEKLMTPQEVSEVLQVSVPTAKRLMQKMRSVNVSTSSGRQTLRVPESVLMQWISDNTLHESQKVKPGRKPAPRTPQCEALPWLDTNKMFDKDGKMLTGRRFREALEAQEAAYKAEQAKKAKKAAAKEARLQKQQSGAEGKA